jgi:hypothetical protein
MAQAALLHRYDFSVDSTTSVADTVGTANGTLVGTATVTGGSLVTNGGNGTINGIWTGTGPRMTLDPSAVSGITGAFTIEDWFTCTTGWPKFDTMYAFSDTTIDNYLLAAPVRGYSPWPSGVAVVGAGGLARGSSWDYVVQGIYLDTPSLHQTVITYDGTTFTYYVDGVLANHAALAATLVNPGFNLSLLTAIGVNGGSPYSDPSLTGSTSDFRIYGQGMTADQVAALYALGANASNAGISQVIPEPGTVALSLAAVGLLLRRRS